MEIRLDHFTWFIPSFIRSAFFREKRLGCLSFMPGSMLPERRPVELRVHLYQDIQPQRKVRVCYQSSISGSLNQTGNQSRIQLQIFDLKFSNALFSTARAEIIVMFND